MENTSGASSISRLEAKEILRYLDTTQCDDEVVIKLVRISGGALPVQDVERPSHPQAPTPTESISLSEGHSTPSKRVLQIRQHNNIQGDPLDPVAEPKYLVWEELGTKEQLAYGSTDGKNIDENLGRASLATINNERRATWLAQSRMQRHVPSLNPLDATGAEFAPPDRPAHWSIERVAVGQKNAVGDMCTGVTPEGLSVCVCPRGHGYIMNNHAVPGCTMCAALGYSREGATEQDEPEEPERAQAYYDDGAIEGHDSRF